MSILELIVILIISDAVQNSMVGENTTLWGGLVAVLTLLGLDVALKALTAGRAGVRAASSRASRACSSATAGCSTKALREERRRAASEVAGRRPGRRASPGSRTSAWRSSRPMARSA